MSKTTAKTRKAVYEDIIESVPSGLLTLHLPPGKTLTRWVEEENARLKARYPEIKKASKELGPVTEAEYQAARKRLKKAEQDYELLKLRIREDLGSAAIATSGGIGFIERRIYTVPTFITPEYRMDALFPKVDPI